MNDSSHLAGAVAEKSKHTPGPWKVHPREGMARSYYGTHVAASHYSTPGVSSGRDSVCDCTGEHQDANARLIAAAPELLEALRTLVSRDFAYYGGFVMDCNITMEEVQRARAAIAKAEGE